MLSWVCPKCKQELIHKSLKALSKHRCDAGLFREPDKALPWSARIERKIQSQNHTQWAHWTVSRKDRRAWTAALVLPMAALVGCRLPYSAWHITRCYGGRSKEMDFANLVGGAKSIPDALIELDVIKDDSPSHFHCTYEQARVTGSDGYTVLTLKDWHAAPKPLQRL